MKPSSLSGTGLCVCFQLRRTSRAITQLFDVALQPGGIRSTQFALLVAVAKKEPITISELGDLLVIDSTTLSRSLRKLEQMAFLKTVSGSDRRERLVQLTAKGRRVLEKSLPYWRRVQAEVVSRLTDPGWCEIRKDLQDLKDVSQRVFEHRAE
ncbi:MAG TPA: winged helix DNA-binding protein [Candidatus Angelobacter sp.]